MAFNLPTHVDASNWRRVRLAWMNRCDEVGLTAQADAFWCIGAVERNRPCWEIDDERYAQVVADEILRTFTAARMKGVDL